MKRKRWDKLPVEQLDESSFDRIARRLEPTETVVPAQSPVRSRRWPVFAVAAAAACGAAVAWFVLRPQPVTLSHVVTEAAPSRVVAGGVVLDVGPFSSLSYEGDLHVVLEKGHVLCDVMPRGTRPPVVVEAGDVSVRVIGTRFAVYREGASARVEVEHGVVQVVRGGQSAQVAAGEKWPVAVQETPKQPETPEPQQPEPAPHVAPPPVHRHTTTPPPKHAATPAPSARERYEAAARLESKDPATARTMYAELAKGDDAWAQNALYAEARLAHEQGRKDEAIRLCRQYLARFPSGANAQDARELLDRLK